MTVFFFTLNNKIAKKTSFLIINSMLLACLCVILATYMTIRKRVRSTNPAVKAHNRKTIQQNVKLPKTLFVAIGLSFAFWLPVIMMYSTLVF